MQSSRNEVEPASPNQPGKTRPPSKEFGCKRNVRKEESEMWCRMFELLVRKKQIRPNTFLWPKKYLVGLNVGCILCPRESLL